jgi:flagellar basal body rod protein FlgG
MLDGLYKGASALDMLARQQETVAANIAHLNTPGYRREIFSFAQTSDTQASGESAAKSSVDFQDGRLEPTGRKLDLAVQGDGFFVYEGDQGKLYSRSGVLFFNPENNQLVNGDGLPILGENGPITIDGELSQLVVGADGTISVGQEQIGKLSIMQFDNNRLLQSEGQIYFRAGTAQATDAEGVQVQQGVRELSNAHAVTEMIALIVGSRHFEASQRAIRMISDTMQEAAQS